MADKEKDEINIIDLNKVSKKREQEIELALKLIKLCDSMKKALNKVIDEDLSILEIADLLKKTGIDLQTIAKSIRIIFR